MIQVNIAGLAAALQKAPPFIMCGMNKGTSYLFDRVYTRLASGGEVRLSNLDFSVFEEEDINSLIALHNDVFERNIHQAERVADTLRKIEPICKPAAYI